MDDASPGVIRRATPDEAPLLIALTGRSALFWGYEPESRDWEPESLRVTGELIVTPSVYVLEEDGRVLGYDALLDTPEGWYLDKLFVEPGWIGTGHGGRLWRHAVATSQDLGATRLTLYTDPNAASFYRATGATWLREEPTSRPGWNLQVVRVDIPPIGDGAGSPQG